MGTTRILGIIRFIAVLFIVVLFVGCRDNRTGGHGASGESVFTIVSTSPADGVAGVATDTVVSAIFSENTDPSTIKNSTFTMSVWGNNVAGAVSGSGSTATFIPLFPLSDGTLYVVTIKAGVKDTSGNALASDYTWTFTTEGGIQGEEAGDWIKVAAGWEHTMAIKANGTLWACGYNLYGQLGDGTNTDKNILVQVGSDTGWAIVAAGDHHTLAIKEDGTLWAWGENTYGQLGVGNKSNYNVPVQVTSAQWTAVAAGKDQTVAIKKDGTLWTWGRNNYGQLGNGTLSDQKVPVQVGSDTDWAAVAAGRAFSVGIKADGTLWEWGDESHGQLLRPPIYNIPTQSGEDTDWKTLDADGYNTGALKEDGTLWAWNWMFFTAPLGYETDWVAVAVGNDQIYALKNDGSLFAGAQVGSDTNWIAIAAGGNHAAALKKNGTLWTWGRNIYGQLGDGTWVDKYAPVQIGF
jgi:hypothetical protein